MTRFVRAASVVLLALATACARDEGTGGVTNEPGAGSTRPSGTGSTDPSGTGSTDPSGTGSTRPSGAGSTSLGEPRVAPPDGWREFERGRVRFTAPADLVDRELQGIDSLVGGYESAAFRVDFDFGWYSDDSFGGRYDGRTMRDGTLEATTLGERPARLATWSTKSASNDAAGFAHGLGLYVPDVDRTGEAPGETKLSFNVSYRDPADADRARRIATSVVIAPPTH
ncbi:MAG: hypothetical protein HZA52_18260 [Planctomycetes bacterium]|nr:hypothetical protein [Planctomycetota bacterium]